MRSGPHEARAASSSLRPDSAEFLGRRFWKETAAMDVGKSCVAASVDPCSLQVQIWQMFRSVKKADMQVVKKDGFRQRISWCPNYPSKLEDEEKESQVNEGPKEQEEGSSPADLPLLALEARNVDASVIAEEVCARRDCVLPCSMRAAPSLLECSIVNADVFLATSTSSADITDEEKANLLMVRNEVHFHPEKSEERESSEELQIAADRKQAEVQIEVNEPQSCRHSVPTSTEMAATTSVHQPPVVESGRCSALDLEATEIPPAPTVEENLKLGGNITHAGESGPQYHPLVAGAQFSTNGPLQESSGGELLQQKNVSIANFSQTILLHVKAEPVEEERLEMDARNSRHAQSAKFFRKLNFSRGNIELTKSEGQTNLRWEPNRNPETQKEDTTTSDSSGEDDSTCSDDDTIKTARTRRVRYVKKKVKTKARLDNDGEVENGLHPNKHPKLDNGAHEIKKARNKNPGRRVQGGRLYDSVLGRTCHWCRQKTVELHVKCRDCTVRFCGPCLLNRNGERIREELSEGVHWVCPKCRGGCGPGCKNCCNCGPCRKADGKSPTGQRVFAARIAGFSNVHDFLVHLETGESPAVIARRKEGHEWTNGGRVNCEEAPKDFVTGLGEDSCLDGDKGVALATACTRTKLQKQILCRKYAKKVLLQARKKMRGAIQADSPAVHGRMPGAIHCKGFSLPTMKINGPVPHICTGKRTKSRSNRARHATCKVEPASSQSVAGRTQTQEGATAISVCKREFEEPNKEMAGCKVEVVGCEEYRLGKRLRAELKDPANHSGVVDGALQVEESTSTHLFDRSAKNSGRGEARSVQAVAATQSCTNGREQSHIHKPMSSCMECMASADDPVDHLHKKEVTEEHMSASDDLGDGLSKRNKFNRSRPSPNGERSPQLDDDYYVTDSKITSKEVLSKCMPSLTPKQNEWGPPSGIQGEEYCVKLRATLAAKFDAIQLEELLASASCRKPVLRVRHMRGRTIDSVTKNKGLSYLDHHPDLAGKLANATKPEDKLSLLRGLFFWLQHSCMVGAFKPWIPPPPLAVKEQNGDCFETNGPDCKVTAVVYSLDKTMPMRHSGNHKSSKASSQSVQQKCKDTTSVRQRQSDVEGTANYEVVLCLPAPKHSQVTMKGSTTVKLSAEYRSG